MPSAASILAASPVAGPEATLPTGSELLLHAASATPSAVTATTRAGSCCTRSSPHPFDLASYGPCRLRHHRFLLACVRPA